MIERRQLECVYGVAVQCQLILALHMFSRGGLGANVPDNRKPRPSENPKIQKMADQDGSIRKSENGGHIIYYILYIIYYILYNI